LRNGRAPVVISAVESAISTSTHGRSLSEPPNSPPVTDLLLAWGRGDESAFDRLIPLVHVELRRLARRYMRGANHQTLQTTVLVNEAYLRLVDLDRVRWQDRAHFFRNGGAADAPHPGGSRPLASVREAGWWRAVGPF
jgi:hypothetical protein